MKKLFALLLALCLLGSVAMAETAAKEVSWNDVEAAAAEVPGGFVTIEELGLNIWLPEGYAAQEVTEEQQEQGIFALYRAADASGAVGFQYYPIEGNVDVEAIANAVPGASEIEALVINGLSCIGFDLKEQNASCLAFGTQKENLLVITFAPADSADYAAKAQIMAASIHNAE